MDQPIIRNLSHVEGSAGVVTTKRMFAADEGAAATMLHAAIAPGGSSHEGGHSHRWHHSVFILSGEGTLRAGGVDHPVRAGDAVYVPPHIEHAFLATGDEPLVRVTVNPPEAG